jgi:hypothetical protein
MTKKCAPGCLAWERGGPCRRRAGFVGQLSQPLGPQLGGPAHSGSIIEKRWQERFGKDVIDRLQELLQALVDNFDGDLPDYVPILGYDLLSLGPDRERRRPAGVGFAPSSECTLPILLSKVLLAFAIEFECDSGVSLAMSSNALRLIGQPGARVRDLSRLPGVSKQGDC